MVLLTAGWMWPGWHGGLSQWLRMMKMMMPMSVAARAADYAVSGEVGLQGLTRSVYVVFCFSYSKGGTEDHGELQGFLIMRCSHCYAGVRWF